MRWKAAGQLAQTLLVGLALLGAAVLAILILTAAFRIGERALPDPAINERPLSFTAPGPVRENPIHPSGVVLGEPQTSSSLSSDLRGLITLNPPIDAQ